MSKPFQMPPAPPLLDWEIREKILAAIGPACRTFAQLRHTLAPLTPAEYMPALERLCFEELEIVTLDLCGLTHHYRRDEELPPRSNGHSLDADKIAEANERLRRGELQPPQPRPQRMEGTELKTKSAPLPATASQRQETEETDMRKMRHAEAAQRRQELLPAFIAALKNGHTITRFAADNEIHPKNLSNWVRERPDWRTAYETHGQHRKKSPRSAPTVHSALPAPATALVVSDSRLTPHLAAKDAAMKNVTPSAATNGHVADAAQHLEPLRVLAAQAQHALDGEEIEGAFFDFHGEHSHKLSAVREVTRSVLAEVARFNP